MPGHRGARIRRAHRAGEADLAPNARRVPARDPDQPVAPAVCRGTAKYERAAEHPDGRRGSDRSPTIRFTIRPSLIAAISDGAGIRGRRNGDSRTLADCDRQPVGLADATTGRPSLGCADPDAHPAAEHPLGLLPEPYNLVQVGRNITVRLTKDRPGELAGVVQILSRAGVNIEGVAEVEGVVHVLARDPNAARSALRSGGYTIDGEVEVLVLPMTDRPGELSMIMQRLADASVNVRFVYLATETRVVIGVDDITQARRVLDASKN